MKILLTLLLSVNALLADGFTTVFMSSFLFSLSLLFIFFLYSYLKKLQKSEEKMGLLFEYSDVPTLYINKKDKIITLNETARTYLGSKKVALRQSLWYEKLLPDENALKIRHHLYKNLKKDARVSFDAPLVKGSGESVHTRYTLSLAPAPLTGYIMTLSDITASIALEKKLYDTQEALLESNKAFEQMRGQFQVTFDIAINGIVLLDNEGKITYLNRALCEMFEYNEDYIRHLGIRVVFGDAEPCLQLLQSVKQGEKVEGMHYPTHTRTGTPLDVSLTMDYLPDLKQFYLVVQDITKSLADINALKQTTKSLEQRVVKDYLTSAYNRAYMEEHLQHLIFEEEISFGFILFDIDYFKKVNDTYGHLVGDDVLITLVDRLNRVLKKHEVLARYGGEEFVVILSGVSHDGSLARAEVLRHLIEEITVEGLPKITCSFGVSCYDGSQDKRALIHAADNALYAAKDRGRNCVVDARELS